MFTMNTYKKITSYNILHDISHTNHKQQILLLTTSMARYSNQSGVCVSWK